MKAAVVVKVEGGYLVFPDEIYVTEKKVMEGSFTPGTYKEEAWDIVTKIEQIQRMDDCPVPAPAPFPARKVEDDIPF